MEKDEQIKSLKQAIKTILWKLNRKVETPSLIGYDIVWAKIDKNDATIREAEELLVKLEQEAACTTEQPALNLGEGVR